MLSSNLSSYELKKDTDGLKQKYIFLSQINIDNT